MKAEKFKGYKDYVGFFEAVGKSKRLLRSGWIREKIKDPESVAEHSFRDALMAMVLAGEVEDEFGRPLDRDKLIKMALLHDIGEVITGDIVVERHDIIDLKKRDEKELAEREGIRKIFDMIGQADEYVTIFDEMTSRITPEAKFFWQIDKLEMAQQALEYEEEQGVDLSEFFLGVKVNHMKHPLLKQIFDSIMRKRRRQEKKK